MSWWDKREGLDERFRAVGIDPKSKISRHFFYLVNEILGFPRHLSQHVGGFVISRGPLAQLVPIENTVMKDRTIIQWDKDDIESLGLLKIDVLGLGMLTAIRKTLALINNFRRNPRYSNGKNIEGPEQPNSLVQTPSTNLYECDLTVDRIPPEDPETYSMLQHGDSVGVFQVESRAQMAMLPRLRPNNFYDLVIEVGIVRPGPIQGNMVHPYLRRREGLEPITYSSKDVRKVLERTLGIPIFQEQVIELAIVAAGFTAGEADQLRRAITNWRRRGGLEHFKDKFIHGMLQYGHDLEFAERIFQQIRGFGEYGFPESHAASFALLVYISAWLKRHEPSAFYCGLLNSLPMGFYTPSQLLQDAVAHGIEVREINVQTSTWDYLLEPRNSIVEPTGNLQFRGPTLEQPAIRLGLRQIKGLQKDIGNRIAAAQPFVDVDDLARRTSLGKQQLYFLARAGALKHLTGHRYQAHWDAAGIDNPSEMWKATDVHRPYETAVKLDKPTEGDNLLADYRYLGLTLGPHPMRMLREDRAFHGYKTASVLIDYYQNQFVKVAGIVTCRQRPESAGGVVFLTLEDETGNTNIVVWHSVMERNRSALLQGQLLAIKGVVKREGQVIHVVAGHVQDMTYKLSELSEYNAESVRSTGKSFPTRNFH
jgi:error-prone DNA polymerase